MREADRAKLEEAYRAHGSNLWRAIYAFAGGRASLADDVVSEAFAQAGRRIEAIRDLRAWLFRAAFRIAAGELAHVHEESIDGNELSAFSDDLDLELREMASHLSPAQRRAFVLRELLGFSTAETAKLVGSSEVSVRVHLHAARRRLAEMMREEIG